MAYGRARPGWGALAVCGMLLAGCTDDGGGDGAGTGTKGGNPSGGGVTVASPEAPSSPSAEPQRRETDPELQPGTEAEAKALIGKVIAGPDLFPPEARQATPYESDPSRWAVLGRDCVWQREPLPDDVLATLTRHFEVPADDGKGLVRISATVTVHRTSEDAGWEQAGMLEESVDCGEQVLQDGERLTGLITLASKWGEGNNRFSEDSLIETGQCVSEAHGGPYPYWWSQATFGPVTAATSVCGGRGYDDRSLQPIVERALPWMLLRAQEQVGRPVEGKAGSASPGGTPSGADSGAATGEDSGAESGADSGAKSGTDAAAAAGSGTDSAVGVGFGADSGAGSGADSGVKEGS
ncbi:hypothetical protein ACFXAZ_30595 [Streptomyces sp. NPDC059477]|uniref:hypothetical protein n=1 Tax=Streptomyces sp. NPDC059477 TaxID=3346847 RepID=UPI00367D6D5C